MSNAYADHKSLPWSFNSVTRSFCYPEELLVRRYKDSFPFPGSELGIGFIFARRGEVIQPLIDIGLFLGPTNDRVVCKLCSYDTLLHISPRSTRLGICYTTGGYSRQALIQSPSCMPPRPPTRLGFTPDGTDGCLTAYDKLRSFSAIQIPS